jgi:hypothetical protein
LSDWLTDLGGGWVVVVLVAKESVY